MGQSLYRSACIALCGVVLLGADAHGATKRVTIQQALRLARQNNPDLRIARASLGVAIAHKVGARFSHPFNPSVSLSPGLRIGDNRKLALDLEFGLNWEVEIAGQKGLRLRAAGQDILVARARVRYLEWAISRQVLLAFHRVLLVRKRISTNLQVRALTMKLCQAVKQRFEAGQDSVLNVNLAQLERVEVDRRRLELEANLQTAQMRLTVLMGLGANVPVRVEGSARLPERLGLSLAELLKYALATRQDLVALQREILANRQRIKLADAKRIPNLVFSLKYGREEDSNLIIGGIGLSLPFFQKNQGDRALFRALGQKLRQSERKARYEVERSVVAAWLAHQTAQRRITYYNNKIFKAFSQQLQLLEKSYLAGKIGLLQVLLFQRQLLRSQREIVNAEAALISSRIRLEQAVGGSLSLKQKKGSR